jgi:glucosamine-6-phosphate deaminase
MTEFTVDGVRVRVHESDAAAGLAAGAEAAGIISAAIERQGRARVVFASAPSQELFLRALTAEPGLDWTRVRAFHMDEYIGLPDGAPQSFARWLAERIPGRVEPIVPGADPEAEIGRYTGLLAAGPIDLVCLGIGVNGHIAFNEPGRCRFDDPESVRLTELDERSRVQQVDDGCFADLADVPHAALTLTIPALTAAARLVATVPGPRKADAVTRTLTGPVGPGCPATALRGHPGVTLHLDPASAAGLPVR